MPQTITNTTAGTPRDPTGDAYANHDVGLTPAQDFDGGAPKPGGLYPNATTGGIDGTDEYHVHAIILNGVIWKIAVTFLLTTADNDHVGTVFYWPDKARSSTYYRFRSSKVKNLGAGATAFADGVFDRYFAACPKIPGATANECLLSAINAKIRADKEMAEAAPALKLEAIAAAKDTGQTARDKTLFGQAVKDGVITDEEAVAKIKAYTDTGVDITPGDQIAIKLALKAGKAKDKWNSWIQKYYDGVMA